MEHHVADRDGRAKHGEQAAREREAPAVTVHDGLHGEADGEGQPGDAELLHQSPQEGADLPAELVAAEPEEEPGARADIGDPWIGIR